MVLLSKKQQIAIKAEAAEGTFEPVAAANAGFNTFDVQFTPDIQQVERNPNRGTIGVLPSLAGVKLGSVRFRTELVGSGNGSDPEPPWEALLLACGFARASTTATYKIAFDGTPATSGKFIVGETITLGSGTATVVVPNIAGEDAIWVSNQQGTFSTGTCTGGTSGATGNVGAAPTLALEAIYRPSSAAGDAFSIGLYQDGRVHRLRGCRGNVSLRAVVGEPVSLNFEFQGAIHQTADASLLTGITYPSLLPPQGLGILLELGEYNPVLETLELDMGNNLAPRRNLNDAAGVISTRITSRSPRGSMDPESVLIGGGGGNDFFNSLYAGTQFAAEAKFGSAAGNTFYLHAPKLQYANVGQGDRNEILTDNVDLRLNETSGDDDFILMCQ